MLRLDVYKPEKNFLTNIRQSQILAQLECNDPTPFGTDELIFSTV